MVVLTEALMIGNKYLMSKGAIWPSSAQFRVTPTRKLQGPVRLTHSPEGNRNNEKNISLMARKKSHPHRCLRRSTLEIEGNHYVILSWKPRENNVAPRNI